jgi:hypothetical protein
MHMTFRGISPRPVLEADVSILFRLMTFVRGKIGYGSSFKHVAKWWKPRNDPNVLFLTYEELSRDLEGCLR